MTSQLAHNDTNGRFTILECLDDQISLSLTLVYASVNILLSPLFILVLLCGLKQWQKQQGALSLITTSDILTYNLAGIELTGVFSSMIFAAASWAHSTPTLKFSYCLFVMYFFGESLFQCAICVDKYLAVVHPITYRNLKESRAVFVRNIVIALNWLIVFLWIPLVLTVYPDFPAQGIMAAVVICAVLVLYFCSASLYILKRPGPNGKKDDQSKLKAFQIISLITCLLLVKILGMVVYSAFYFMSKLRPHLLCITLMTSVIIVAPINGLLSLLYLRRKMQTSR